MAKKKDNVEEFDVDDLLLDEEMFDDDWYDEAELEAWYNGDDSEDDRLKDEELAEEADAEARRRRERLYRTVGVNPQTAGQAKKGGKQSKKDEKCIFRIVK